MKRHITFFLLLLYTISCFAKDKVILIHGLGRTANSMEKLQISLQEDYDVISLNYPSTKYEIQTICDTFLVPLISNLSVLLQENERIHFVTHSLGGIVLRYYLSQNELQPLGRIVLLAPPNKGSEVADFLGDTGIMGPALMQLKTDSLSFVNTLPSFPCEFGVITGSRSYNWINSILIKGKDDGKVSIEKTKLNGMKDFKVVAYTHTFIMNKESVQKDIKNFLKKGSFE